MMVEMLNQLLLEYCAGEEAPVRKTKEGPSCEWEEYEQTGEYINKIDEIIQESLFKPKEDSAKRDAQFGFVEINMLLNKRVEKLFSDGMVCPNEATAIKKEWMPELNKCMSVFMNLSLEFMNTDMHLFSSGIHSFLMAVASLGQTMPSENSFSTLLLRSMLISTNPNWASRLAESSLGLNRDSWMISSILLMYSPVCSYSSHSQLGPSLVFLTGASSPAQYSSRSWLSISTIVSTMTSGSSVPSVKIVVFTNIHIGFLVLL